MLGFFRRFVGKELSPEEQAQKRNAAIAAGAGNGALTVCVHFLVWDGDSEDSAHANIERLLKSAAAAGLVTSSGGAADGGVVVDDMDGGVNRRVPSIVRLGQNDAPTFAPDGSCYNLTGGGVVSAPHQEPGSGAQFMSAATIAAFAEVYARVNCLPTAVAVGGTGVAARGTGGAWRVPNERTHPWLASYSSAGTAPAVQFISPVSAEGIAVECASRLSDEFMAHAPILVVPEIGSTEEEFVLQRIAAYRREFGAENGDNDERVYSDADGESPDPPRPRRFLGEGGVEEEVVDAEEEGPHVEEARHRAAARRAKGLESIDRVSLREQLLASEYMQCACDMDPVRRTIFRAAANEWDDELVTTAEFSVAFQKSISVQHAAACDMKAQEGNLAERALAKKRAARQGGDLDSNMAPAGRFDDALSARTVGPNATLSADAKKKALLNAKQFGEIASQISRGVSVLSHMIVVVPATQFRRIYEQVLDPRFSEEAHYVLAEAEQRAHFCPGSVTQIHLTPSVAHTVQAQLVHEARRHAAATGASGDEGASAQYADGFQSARPTMSAWGADSSSVAGGVGGGGSVPPPSARTTNAAHFLATTPSVDVAFDPQGAASAARAFVGEGGLGVIPATTDGSSTIGGSSTLTSAGVPSHSAGSAYNTSQAGGTANATGSATTFGVGNGGYGQGENFERTRAAVGVAGGWTLSARWSGAAAAPLNADITNVTGGGGGGAAAVYSAMLPHLNVAARVGVALHPHPANFYEAIRPTWVRQLTAAAQARAGGAVGTAVDMNGGAAAAAAGGAASPLSSLGSLASPMGDNVPLVGARNPFASPHLSAQSLAVAGGEMMPAMQSSSARNPVQALSQYVDHAIAPPAFPPGTDRKQQAIQLDAHRERLRSHLDRLLDVLATAGDAPFFLSCTRRDEICRLRTPATIETLLLILYNLDQKPTEQRFRILACGSERFYETLGKYPAAMAVLGGVGFSRFGATARVLVLSEAEAAAWAVERRRCIAVLEALYEARRIQHYLNPPPPQRNMDDITY